LKTDFLGNPKQLVLTKGFVQLGLDVAAIIGSAYPSFIFGGLNSAGQ
jgi:hypothetical protein